MTGSAKRILAVGTIAAAAALGTAGVATASDGAVRPDDRAIHGTGAVALERSDRVVRPDDRADRRIAPRSRADVIPSCGRTTARTVCSRVVA